MNTTTKQFVRNDGRTCTQVRPLSLVYNPFGYADCSVLLSIGDTKVLVAVTLQEGVPFFLRNSGNGWLTAEYAMLPTATRSRTPRDGDSGKKNGRSVEIARLIGRSLRSIINFKDIGERTITIDCDVLQADGGTRAACITAASYALQRALVEWQAQGRVPAKVKMRPIAALSAGHVANQLMVDLTQKEDNSAAADVTFVLTAEGDVVEVQATGEHRPLPWDSLVNLKEMTAVAMQELFLL
ncbi:MAG: ribonuclease [Candidatus Dependentiae bacterium]|nr:ribonuclease [Candidatus Dependentiae bacterium]